MSNRSKTLYTGFTNDLQKRVWQHKNHVFEGFTDRYNCDRLVYFERFTTPQSGISREKQIKGWKRIRKIAIIVGQNPTWRDLSEDWGTPLKLIWRPPNAWVLRSAQDDDGARPLIAWLSRGCERNA